MDNQTIDVVSEGEAGIGHALAIIWNAATPGGQAKHYKVVKLVEETIYYVRDCDAKDSNVYGAHQHAHHATGFTKNDLRGIPTLILLWHEEDGSTPLPFPLDKEQAAKFIADWLKQADFPDREWDGEVVHEHGWRLFTESWGHVAGHHYAIVGVQPAWALYGK